MLATVDVHPTNNPLLVWCVHQTAAEGSNLYGQENVNYPVLETYEEGSVMEVKVVVSTNHWVSYPATIGSLSCEIDTWVWPGSKTSVWRGE